ncbi:hypothetical protein F511_45233 [Dorcoceras hygrometricum]|uniref:Uncharacterized protein n=1 Tax=Dorcoceras hygrometricum TaxID=472368 RepID=A0A2Z6ZWM4_9LAMI|nr:hypothetical protein F511_45233 [Dorcoceras hygrometricum]
MSATPPPPPPQPLRTSTTTEKSSFSQDLSSIGLGYAIAIAFGFLVLFSTVLLASYICCRSATIRRRRQNHHSPSSTNPNPSAENSVYLPRIIFVAEDDENDSQNVVVGLDQASSIHTRSSSFRREAETPGTKPSARSVCASTGRRRC